MMLPLFVPMIVVALVLLLGAIAACTAISLLRRAPVILGLLAALAGVGLAAGIFAVRSALRRSQARETSRRSSEASSVSWKASSTADFSRGYPHAKAAPRIVSRPAPVGQYADDARRLVEEIKDILRNSPLSPEQKSALLAQVRAVPESTTRAMNKLGRLRKIRSIAQRTPGSASVATTLHDIDQLEDRLVAELQHMRETLLAISVGLVRVDVVRGDRSLDRMVAELSHTNQRLSDLADSYGEVRAEQAFT
jgi:hypothetical protein